MFKNLAIIIALLIPLKCIAELQPGPLIVVLVGSKDAVVSVLNESMNIEFSRGVTSRLSDNIGFQSNFEGFWTGRTEIRASLIPLSSGDSLEPTAYTFQFWWKTQRDDLSDGGKRHATSLVSQIKSIAAKHGDVAVADNISIYRDMGEQYTQCNKMLDSDPLLTSIKDKIALSNGDNTTFSMLANDSIPTEEERKVIAIYATKKDLCSKIISQTQSFFPNDAGGLLAQTLNDTNNQLNMALYKGQLSYGNYAKIRKENNVRYKESQLKIRSEINAKNADANERAQRIAIEQQRLFIEQQKAYAELYKPIIPIRSIRSTDCQLNGNQMNCTTY